MLNCYCSCYYPVFFHSRLSHNRDNYSQRFDCLVCLVSTGYHKDTSLGVGNCSISSTFTDIARCTHNLTTMRDTFACVVMRTQDYLILFAPPAFVSQCQFWPSRALSPLVFLQISTHFTAPLGIPSASTILKLVSAPMPVQG
jgi:hypothetical protein